ncbi:MAG: hypothetical protein U0V04_10675 [Spirosomataceae bacterium]
MQTINQSRSHEVKAWGISIFIYAAILVSLYLIKIVYEPVEELAMGFDLNYGVDLVGSGNIQTHNQANDSKENFEAAPPSGNESPKKVEISKPEPVVEKSIPIKTSPSKVITSDEDTKVTMKESKEPAKPSKPVAESNNNTTKTTAPPAPKERTVDNGSIFKKPGSGGGNSNGTIGTKSGIGGNNNGDGKPGEVGDKGDPRGTVDGKSMMGKPGKGGNGNGGTGSGTSVNISGWKNKGPLNIPKDNSSETGRIKFKVIIDDFGDVQRIDVIETSLSPSVTNYYKTQITKKLKTNLVPEGTPPPRSTGTITINITRG